jgi:hypothetical protein
MPTPMDINEWRGDESVSAHRLRKNHWTWLVAAAVVVVLVLVGLALTGAAPSVP